MVGGMEREGEGERVERQRVREGRVRKGRVERGRWWEGEKEGRTHLFDPIWSSSLSWITFTTSKLQNMKLP